MATSWVKSLHCKSMEFEDVRCPTTKHSLLVSSDGCRHTSQTIRNILNVSKHLKPTERKNPKPAASDTDVGRASGGRRARSERHQPGSSALCPAPTELPEGHPSRNVVEIIFHIGWGSRPFPARVERIFKFQNKPSTVARFEEYRGSVQFRARQGQSSSESVGNRDNARCLVDGNEMMGFQCVGGAGRNGAVCEVSALSGCGKEMKGRLVAVRMFSGSRLAHENAGGGNGRKAMLVCRVIAGRVLEKGGLDPISDGLAACDSISWRKGELVVLDSKAVLPCFLIIYKL